MSGKNINELDLSENAIKVLEKRYLKRDKDGNCIETPADMFRRVADTLASADSKFGKSEAEINQLADEFYETITNRYFMPNSPTLMNAGRKLGQLAACFVLPIDDSLEDIFETIKNKIPKYQSYIFSEKKNKYALLIPVINEGERFVSQMNKMKENNIFNICDVFICDGGSSQTRWYKTWCQYGYIKS